MGTPTWLGAHFFMSGGLAGSAGFSGENCCHFRLVEVIQRSFYQPMHAIGHAAERQGYRAVWAVHIVGEVSGNGADGLRVFGGAGEQCIGVDVGAHAEELAVAFGWFWVGWREVVVEGALGGAVEFV